jgi:hypothetical protein
MKIVCHHVHALPTQEAAEWFTKKEPFIKPRENNRLKLIKKERFLPRGQKPFN